MELVAIGEDERVVDDRGVQGVDQVGVFDPDPVEGEGQGVAPEAGGEAQAEDVG